MAQMYSASRSEIDRNLHLHDSNEWLSDVEHKSCKNRLIARSVQIQNTSVFQMVFESVEELQLLLGLQIKHLGKQFSRWCCANKAGDVHIHEGGHKELTVEAVHDAAVAGNHIAKVLEE